MKKILAFAVAMLLGVSAFAQVQLGAGYARSTDNMKLGANEQVALNGFYLSAGYELNVWKFISVVPAVQYSCYTLNEELIDYSLAGILTERLTRNTMDHYITVPVDIKFSFPIGNKVQIFVYGGPRFEAGLSSKAQYVSTSNVSIANDSAKVDYFNKDRKIGTLDAQLGVGGGIQIGEHLQIKGGYDWGMLNHNQADNKDKVNYRRNVVKAGIAFVF